MLAFTSLCDTRRLLLSGQVALPAFLFSRPRKTPRTIEVISLRASPWPEGKKCGKQSAGGEEKVHGTPFWDSSFFCAYLCVQLARPLTGLIRNIQ